MPLDSSSDDDDDATLNTLFASLKVKVDADPAGRLTCRSDVQRSSSSPVAPNITLREYQQRLLDDIKKHFWKGQRSVLAYLPTGGGKTRVGAAAIASWVSDGSAATVRRRRCLFVVNKKALLVQTHQALVDLGFGADAIRMIGGGHAPAADDNDDDSNALSTPLIYVAMIQSMKGYLASHSLHSYTFAIIDECHGAAADTYVSLIRALPEDARVLGLTATPFRNASDPKKLNSVFPVAAWGPSISCLIDKDFLVRPIVYAPTLSSPSKSQKGVSIRDAVRAWLVNANNERTVAFCASVDESQKLADAFVREGVCAEHIDGNTKEKERQRMFDALKDGSLRVLCNKDVLTEGFDEPRIACVLLLRQTESRRVYVQQVGRGLRKSDLRKTRCVVLDQIGVTWNHGPLTGPIQSDYAWEEAVGAAEGDDRADRADSQLAQDLLRRCQCGVVYHRGHQKCPACGAEAPSDADSPPCRPPPRPLSATAAAAKAAAAVVSLAVPLGQPKNRWGQALAPAMLSESASARAVALELKPSLITAPAAPARTTAPARQFDLPGASAPREPLRESCAPTQPIAPKPTALPSAQRRLPSAPRAAPSIAPPVERPAAARSPSLRPATLSSTTGKAYDPTAKVIFSAAALAATARAEKDARSLGTQHGSQQWPQHVPHRAPQQPKQRASADVLLDAMAALGMGSAPALEPVSVGSTAPKRGQALSAAKRRTITDATVAGSTKAPAALLDDGALADRPLRPPTDGLAPGWIINFSDKRQRWYYFNHKTGQTQWHRPPPTADEDGNSSL